MISGIEFTVSREHLNRQIPPRTHTHTHVTRSRGQGLISNNPLLLAGATLSETITGTIAEPAGRPAGRQTWRRNAGDKRGRVIINTDRVWTRTRRVDSRRGRNDGSHRDWISGGV